MEDQYLTDISLSTFQHIIIYENDVVIPNLSQLCRNIKEVKEQLARIIVSSEFRAIVTTFDDDGGVEATQSYSYPLFRH